MWGYKLKTLVLLALLALLLGCRQAEPQSAALSVDVSIDGVVPGMTDTQIAEKLSIPCQGEAFIFLCEVCRKQGDFGRCTNSTVHGAGLAMMESGKVAGVSGGRLQVGEETLVFGEPLSRVQKLLPGGISTKPDSKGLSEVRFTQPNLTLKIVKGKFVEATLMETEPR